MVFPANVKIRGCYTSLVPAASIDRSTGGSPTSSLELYGIRTITITGLALDSHCDDFRPDQCIQQRLQKRMVLARVTAPPLSRLWRWNSFSSFERRTSIWQPLLTQTLVNALCSIIGHIAWQTEHYKSRRFSLRPHAHLTRNLVMSTSTQAADQTQRDAEKEINNAYPDDASKEAAADTLAGSFAQPDVKRSAEEDVKTLADTIRSIRENFLKVNGDLLKFDNEKFKDTSGKAIALAPEWSTYIKVRRKVLVFYSFTMALYSVSCRSSM